MFEQALVSVENLAFVSALRNSTLMYPVVNAGHILGVSLLVGGIVPLDLRLIGFWRTYPVMVFVDVLRITAAVGLALAVICGALLFATAAPDYARSPLFQAKIALVLLGVLNALTLGRVMTRRDIRSLPMESPMPLDLRAGGLLSLVVWISVLILGRLLGYF
ncbi:MULTISPECIES: hypothetical protein [Marinobacter]|jgi:uncharacterized membrane protein|uniref:hypothetical protein n=1 Tax=Marinobacter TaxID=2742 RepID=UPI0007D90642|nr:MULTISPECIES: hypothetical protein [Marinobacter]MBL3826623.1 hypothetical protein [Marinobacter sp. MC3]MBL3895168.1 hypothetical protein [Marinobacter sp. MW3]MCD1649331.1 hypothetical protein [Marinobacter adhaerens]OAN93287.1 hypothetical protein A8B80_17125 [Marinobacter sp. EhN04]OAN94296.1 hypothetical protein A8B84_19555 [Marinobacter sp. EhC06]